MTHLITYKEKLKSKILMSKKMKQQYQWLLKEISLTDFSKKNPYSYFYRVVYEKMKLINLEHTINNFRW